MNSIDARIELAIIATLHRHNNCILTQRKQEEVAEEIRIKLQSEGLAAKVGRHG